MPEYFSEDLLDGELIDISEREGGFWDNLKKAVKTVSQSVVNIVNKPQANPILNPINDISKRIREAAEAASRAAAAAEQARREAEARAEQARRDEASRLAAIEAERIKNEATKKTLENTYDQTMIQYQQLVSKGQYLQVQISEQQYQIIPPLNAQIKQLTDENTRLRRKEKSLNDNTTFFKNTVSGRDGKNGYKQKIVKNQQDLESSILKEIGITNETTRDTSDIYIEGLTGDGDEDTMIVNESSEKFRFLKAPVRPPTPFRSTPFKPALFNISNQNRGVNPPVIKTDTPIKAIEIVYISSDVKEQIIELNAYL